MDIPFIGHAIGWHNYKFVAKKELEKVPILGKAIKVAKNVLVDRTDRKSQLLTLKQGIAWLDVSAYFPHLLGGRLCVLRLVSLFMSSGREAKLLTSSVFLQFGW
jgi:1-acyl-sn-glycerol-3-phosphate acyltransferase